MTDSQPGPLRIAHRGIPGRAPENTLAGFRLALGEGAQGIELDVHASSDNVVVVHHDATLRDGRPLSSMSLAELGPFDVPSLRELLHVVRGRAELFVEVKGENIEQLVLDALEGYTGPAAIHSFNHSAIDKLRTFGSPWPLGVLTEDPGADPVALLTLHGAQDFWPHEPLVTAEIVHAVHRAGGRVIPWTVNTPSRMRSLAALGVDGICTDDVSALATALRSA